MREKKDSVQSKSRSKHLRKNEKLRDPIERSNINKNKIYHSEGSSWREMLDREVEIPYFQTSLNDTDEKKNVCSTEESNEGSNKNFEYLNINNNNKDKKYHISDLCEEDKSKLSRLIQQLVKVSSDYERMEKELEKEKNEHQTSISSLKNQIELINNEYTQIRQKFTNSLELLKTYQERLVKLQNIGEDQRKNKLIIEEESLEVVRLKKIIKNQQIEIQTLEKNKKNEFDKNFALLKQELHEANDKLLIEQQKLFEDQKKKGLENFQDILLPASLINNKKILSYEPSFVPVKHIDKKEQEVQTDGHERSNLKNNLTSSDDYSFHVTNEKINERRYPIASNKGLDDYFLSSSSSYPLTGDNKEVYTTIPNRKENINSRKKKKKMDIGIYPSDHEFYGNNLFDIVEGLERDGMNEKNIFMERNKLFDIDNIYKSEYNTKFQNKQRSLSKDNYRTNNDKLINRYQSSHSKINHSSELHKIDDFPFILNEVEWSDENIYTNRTDISNETTDKSVLKNHEPISRNYKSLLKKDLIHDSNRSFYNLRQSSIFVS